MGREKAVEAMKRLLLLRHAKAVTGGTKSGDHARPLNERGRADAPRMGIAMHHKRYRPERVLCSTAKRTVETWRGLSAELDGEPELALLDDLYLAPWKTILACLRKQGGAAATVLVIGHNPGLEDCVQALARKPQSDAERARLAAAAEKFPTATLAVFDFEIASWSEIAPGTGAFVDFLRPRALTGD